MMAALKNPDAAYLELWALIEDLTEEEFLWFIHGRVHENPKIIELQCVCPDMSVEELLEMILSTKRAKYG